VSTPDRIDALTADLRRLNDPGASWSTDDLRRVADRLSRLADALDDLAYRRDRDG
jgi:hypothetical protein